MGFRTSINSHIVEASIHLKLSLSLNLSLSIHSYCLFESQEIRNGGTTLGFFGKHEKVRNMRRFIEGGILYINQLPHCQIKDPLEIEIELELKYPLPMLIGEVGERLHMAIRTNAPSQPGTSTGRQYGQALP